MSNNTTDIKIDISPEYQYPILPTGCEVTSISMLLKYAISLKKYDQLDETKYSKESLADVVTKEDDPSQCHISMVGGNPYRAFVGNPLSKLSFGMFHQPAVALLKDLIDDIDNRYGKSKFTVIDLTEQTNNVDEKDIKYPLKLNESKEYINSRLEYFESEDKEHDNSDIEILKQHLINQRIPIVIWMTLELKKPSITDTWIDINVPENDIHWVSPEHCALLVGFNENEFIINDPHTGKTENYNKDQFLKRWRQMGRQAVTIHYDL